ncbi:MAG: AraC family transcriptional regulator [Planctomycetota bacterium]
MPRRYQDVYPSAPLLKSDGQIGPLASELLTLEYFESDPGEMETSVFAQHHILLNLNENPHRVENWRDGAYRDFIFRPDEVVVTPAGMRSGWRWHARSKVIVVTLDPERFGEFARNAVGVLLTSEQLRDVPQFQDEDLCRAGVLVMDALRERVGSEVIFEALSRVFLVRLIQRYGLERDPDADFDASFTAEQYKRVLDFVARHFARKITLEEMASVAAISESHFARLFKQSVRQTPYQFVIAYRIEKAKEMLADRDRRMSDIALACGFSDQAHFSRLFKRHQGRTPSEWRAGP